MKKTIVSIVVTLIAILAGFIYYYIYLPVINIHSKELWIFVIIVLAVITATLKALKSNQVSGPYPFIIKILAFITPTLAIIFIIGSVLSSPIINAKKYQALISIEQRDFLKDIPEISYNEIPILDKETAINLGQRKMGSIVNLVSQFEVNKLYTQINYKQKPTRVTPLDYGNFFKWLSNRKNGLPAYMKIDMATQEIDLVNLEEGMKYSFSEPFNRNVKRYLRFKFPTYIFDKINFEIDDNGTPFWVAPVRTYSIGLFGGPKISKVVLLNAINGQVEQFNVEDVPTWIDVVYSSELLISYYNYYGSLKNGFLNSILSQKGVLKSTNGFNYIALDDDVWVYTGVTSVSADSSNVGFVLMNQRTGQTRYYVISGAQETSAMASAQGQVQHLKYRATFPLLLNIANTPTYFMALKDEAGLVKKYAMVNIEKYQIVSIGDTISECEENYINLLTENNVIKNNNSPKNLLTGKITFIKDVTIDGNSHIFFKLDSSNELFAVLIKDNINILNYSLGSNISIDFTKKSDFNIVTKIKDA